MTTRNLVPRSANEGQLGTDSKPWQEVNVNKVYASNNVLVFNNVEEMKSSNKVKSGYTIKTLGFYESNDGGGADYVVTDNIGEDETDEASIITLQKGLYAKLLATNDINVKWFGAKFDGATDNTEAIQKAFTFCNYGGTVIFPKLQEIVISKTLTLPIGVSIEGNKSVLKTSENIGYFIEFAKDNPSSVGDSTENNPFNIKSYIKNLRLDSSGAYYSKNQYINNGIDIYNNIKIINLSTFYLNISVNKASGYSDFVIIDVCSIARKVGDDYAITFSALGDGNLISNVHMCEPIDGKINCIHVKYGLQPIYIKNIINGNIRVGYGAMCKIEKLHLEFGNITIDDSAFVSIDTAHVLKKPNIPIIHVERCTGLILNNIHSCYHGDNEDYTNDDCVDIYFENVLINFSMNSCFKKFIGKNIVPVSPLYGIKTNRDKFNINTTALSKMCVASGLAFYTSIKNENPTIKHSILQGDVYQDDNLTWKEENMTVSYTGTLLFDENRKLALLSKTNSTKSVEMTKDGYMSWVLLNTVLNSPIVLVRNGNKKIVVAPIGERIYDTGYMCGGEVWEDYNSTLEEDYQNCYGIEYNPKLGLDNVIAYMDNVPTKGTWSRGDIIKKQYPGSGETFSWVCVSGGTPGIWKALTTIEV